MSKLTATGKGSYWWKDRNGKWQYHKAGTPKPGEAVQVRENKPREGQVAAAGSTESGLRNQSQSNFMANAPKRGSRQGQRSFGNQASRGKQGSKKQSLAMQNRKARPMSKGQALKGLSKDQSLLSSKVAARSGVNRAQAAAASTSSSSIPRKGQVDTTGKGISYNRASGRLINKRKKGYRP